MLSKAVDLKNNLLFAIYKQIELKVVYIYDNIKNIKSLIKKQPKTLKETVFLLN